LSPVSGRIVESFRLLGDLPSALPWAISLSRVRKTLFVWHVLPRKTEWFSMLSDNLVFGSISQNTGLNSNWKYQIGSKITLWYMYANLTQIVQLRSELSWPEIEKALSHHRERIKHCYAEYG
jgi:hypothetical protein